MELNKKFNPLLKDINLSISKEAVSAALAETASNQRFSTLESIPSAGTIWVMSEMKSTYKPNKNRDWVSVAYLAYDPTKKSFGILGAYDFVSTTLTIKGDDVETSNIIPKKEDGSPYHLTNLFERLDSLFEKGVKISYVRKYGRVETRYGMRGVFALDAIKSETLTSEELKELKAAYTAAQEESQK